MQSNRWATYIMQMSSTARDRPQSAHVFVRTEHESLSDTVVRAVSTASGLAATPSSDADLALDPLYTVIDPDTLDTMFAGRAGAGTVTFDYHGYTVTAHGSGRVVLDA